VSSFFSSKILPSYISPATWDCQLNCLFVELHRVCVCVYHAGFESHCKGHSIFPVSPAGDPAPNFMHAA
jgi:hypothetical protein